MSSAIHIPHEHRGVTVRQEGTRVLLLSEAGEVLLDMPWEKAEELARAVAIKAADAEALHWSAIKRHIPGLRVTRVLGMPVVTSERQMEALGGGLKNLSHLRGR